MYVALRSPYSMEWPVLLSSLRCRAALAGARGRRDEYRATAGRAAAPGPKAQGAPGTLQALQPWRAFCRREECHKRSHAAEALRLPPQSAELVDICANIE